jgi:hypothetical protein
MIPCKTHGTIAIMIKLNAHRKIVKEPHIIACFALDSTGVAPDATPERRHLTTLLHTSRSSVTIMTPKKNNKILRHYCVPYCKVNDVLQIFFKLLKQYMGNIASILPHYSALKVMAIG